MTTLLIWDFSTIQTMVYTNERIFPTIETISPVNEEVVSGLETMVFASHTKDSDTISVSH